MIRFIEVDLKDAPSWTESRPIIWEPPTPPVTGLALYDDPEHSKPEVAKILQAIQDSANVALLPSWLRRSS